MLIILARSFLNPGRSFAKLDGVSGSPGIEILALDYLGRPEKCAERCCSTTKLGWGQKPFTFHRRSTSDQGVEFPSHLPESGADRAGGFLRLREFFLAEAAASVEAARERLE